MKNAGYLSASVASPPSAGLLTNLSEGVQRFRRERGTFATWALALLVLYIPLFVTHGLIRILTPAEPIYIEGIIFNQANLMAHGEPIYKDLFAYPYTVAAYSPLSYLIPAQLMKLFGLSFVPMRVLSLFAVLATSFCLGVIVWRRTRDWAAALAGGVLFLTFVNIVEWAAWYRMDTVGLFFTVLGLLVLAGERSLSRVYMAALCFLVSLLIKQTFVAAPLAVGISLLLFDRRLLVHFLGALGVPLLAITAALQWWTGGWFLDNVVLANANPWYWMGVLQYGRFATPHLFIIVGITIALWQSLRRPRDLSVLYALATFLWVLGLAKRGGSLNYLLENAAALSILAGFAFHRVKDMYRQPASLWRRRLEIAILAELFFVLSLPILGILDTRLGALAPQEIGEVVARASAAPGDVLSDDLWLPTLAGKEAVFEPAIYAIFARQGLWDQSDLLQRVREGSFGLVVLRRPLDGPPFPFNDWTWWDEELWHELGTHYVLVEQTKHFYIYEPNHRT
ncbi:MAG: glycosyltransferase family 39 protein [Chloroflexi bacterium]|nr:glycosyltransferase family 39 protein [Chloroflexota bacterium]